MLPLITCLLTLKDNYYANYLTGAWISSFDPCISRGRIFGLIFKSWKVDLYTGKYGTKTFSRLSSKIKFKKSANKKLLSSLVWLGQTGNYFNRSLVIISTSQICLAGLFRSVNKLMRSSSVDNILTVCNVCFRNWRMPKLPKERMIFLHPCNMRMWHHRSIFSV